ncbi:MAG TPA: alpha/beta fold hydrolase [Anaerolineales bacterium]|nr:alpha/beta fold hydrolase [Anaerolineales bacterium]
MKRIVWLTLLLISTACASIAQTPTAIPAFTATLPATATPPPTATPTATLIPTLSPTPDPYFPWSIDHLRSRTYGGGQIEFLEVMSQNLYFTRYLIRYPSDGLNIYGFANIPNDEETHPVIIALHGYIDPAIYNTLDYTTHYADALASAGYIVLHPNLRGYAPSDSGENLFRVGMAIDVLNLISLVQSQSGGTDLLRTARGDRIGLWGHSMGGGISTRVLTVTDDVQAAVLYAAMSGDEQKNYAAIYQWSGQARGLEELNVPAEALNHISAMYFFNNITAAVGIHHGTADALVPPDWSMTTCDQLTTLGKNVECIYYQDMPHTFYGAGDEEFIQNTVQFYNQYLKTP